MIADIQDVALRRPLLRTIPPFQNSLIRRSLETLGPPSVFRKDTRGHPHFLGTGEWVAPSNPWYRRVGGPIQSLVPESGWPHPILCLQVPLDCGQGGRAGSWCLGPRNVCTRPGMVGFPVRRGPPGRSEERNGRSEERNGRSEERNGRSEERNNSQPGSACRWPQVFDTQVIRLRPMTLFNPVFNFLTP